MRSICCCFIMICFLGACAPETNSDLTLKSADSVKIDESKVVLTRFPGGAKVIGDSLLGLITNLHQLSLYDIHTGMNTLNFGTESINFDSLINATWQKRYAGKRIYKYDPLTAGGLSEGNSQLLGFDHNDDKFYVYVNTLVDVNYKGDEEQMKKYSEDPQIQALKAKTGDFDLIVQEYLEFLFVTDKDLRLLTIIPLYQPEKLAAENYSWYFQNGFSVAGNTVYVPVFKDEVIQSTGQPKGSYHALAKFELTKPESAELCLNSSDTGFDPTSQYDFINSVRSFAKDGNAVLFSTGKDICDTKKNKRLFHADSLEGNERISSFYPDKEGHLVMTTYHCYKRKSDPGVDLSFVADSVAGLSIKVYDPEKGSWILSEKIPSGKNYIAAPDRILTIGRSGENYFIGKYDFSRN